MLQEIVFMLKEPNTQWVLLGTALLGLASGVIGSFALLKKQSLIGDAMAHAALPGVCIAFLIYGEKSILLFMIGAAIFGLLATFCIEYVVKHSRIKQDTSIAIFLSVFFGFGIVLLTKISQGNYGSKSGLDAYIFGQAASLVKSDLVVLTIVSIILLLISYLLFKELKILTFDPQFAQGIGLPINLLNGLLMSLIVGAIVIGIQTVGVVLMAAMLITPAIAARYWTERLDQMVIISGMVGALSGIIGTIVSTTTRGLSTGPVIVVCATIIFLFSLLFGSKRGLLIKWLKQRSYQLQVEREQLLLKLYEMMEKEQVSTLNVAHIIHKRYKKGFKQLQKLNYLQYIEENIIELTEKGMQKAYEITLNHRLQEVYVMHENQFIHYDLIPEQKNNLIEAPKPIKEELFKLLQMHKKMPKFIPYEKRGASS